MEPDMCLAIPGQIVGLVPGTDLADADVSGVKRKVNVGLLDDERLAPGDWILIHVGFALSKIDEQEARATLDLLETLGPAFTDELNALREEE
jgi:hydrogenase expression/formation protein HypC